MKQTFSRKDAKAQSLPGSKQHFSLRLCAFAGKTTVGLLAILSLAALFISGCGGSSAAEDKSKIKVGIVFDIGGKDDRSFNAAAWEGVQRAAKDLPIILRDIEPGTPNAIEPAMRAFAERHFDLIIGVGFAQAPIMEQGRERLSKHPVRHHRRHQQITQCRITGLQRARRFLSRRHTRRQSFEDRHDRFSRRHGHRSDSSFRERLRGRRENQLTQTYTSSQTTLASRTAPWNNPGKGKELSLAQIGKGADVIFTAAGNSGLGAFDAVEQQGKQNGRATHFVIGVDSNQNMVKPGFVLTSMVKRVDNAVYDIVNDVVNHRFSPGIHVFGLDKDGVGYAMDDLQQRPRHARVDPGS
jgi:basic membrane protein A